MTSFWLTRCICFGVNSSWKDGLWVSVENKTNDTELYSSLGSFSAVDTGKEQTRDNYVSIRFPPHEAVNGDLRVKLNFRRVKLCSVAVHTGFLEAKHAPSVTIYFPLQEVDDACRPRNQHLFPGDFGVRLFFSANRL
jgi:C2 domain of PTEN tumour-suppressor protein